MGELKNPKFAIPVVLFAGVLWSFGPYVVRNINLPLFYYRQHERSLSKNNKKILSNRSKIISKLQIY